MARRKKTVPKSGHTTAPSRSPGERHALGVMAAERYRSPLEKNEVRRKPDLRTIEDLRSIPRDVDKRESFKTRSAAPARQIRRPERQVSRSALSVPVHDYFQDPKRVLVCIRRHDRRSVLFALRKAGKGKRVSRERKYTDKSYVRCK